MKKHYVNKYTLRLQNNNIDSIEDSIKSNFTVLHNSDNCLLCSTLGGMHLYTCGYEFILSKHYVNIPYYNDNGEIMFNFMSGNTLSMTEVLEKYSRIGLCNMTDELIKLQNAVRVKNKIKLSSTLMEFVNIGTKNLLDKNGNTKEIHVKGLYHIIIKDNNLTLWYDNKYISTEINSRESYMYYEFGTDNIALFFKSLDGNVSCLSIQEHINYMWALDIKPISEAQFMKKCILG